MGGFQRSDTAYCLVANLLLQGARQLTRLARIVWNNYSWGYNA
jgi:hypothetical protein